MTGRPIRRLGADEGGAAALEFALVFPVLLIMLFGVVEIGSLIVTSRRTDNAAASVGDLVTRFGTLTTAQENGLFAAATDILGGGAAAVPDLRVSQVMVTAKGTKVYDWSDVQGTNLAAHAHCSLLSSADAARITPLNLTTGDYVVVSEVRYTWNSPLHSVLPVPLVLNNLNVLSPRAGSVVRDYGTTPPAACTN